MCPKVSVQVFIFTISLVWISYWWQKNRTSHYQIDWLVGVHVSSFRMTEVMNSLEPGTEDFGGGGAAADQDTVSLQVCVTVCVEISVLFE